MSRYSDSVPASAKWPSQANYAPTTKELNLAPPTTFQKLWALAWSGGLSFFAGGLIYGIYFLLADAIYKFGGRTYTLSNAWNNWPQSAGLPQTLSFAHVGGEGGLGTWFVSAWPEIQKVLLQGWPISILAGAFVALALNKGATKKVNWFDHLTLKMHDVFGVIPSRLQPEPTTGPQYAFVLPLAMLFALPGAIVFFGLDFGGIALLHHAGVHGFIIDKVLNAVWFQILVGGVASHQLFANKITMKPAADFMEFFEDRALTKAVAGFAALEDFKAGNCDKLTAFERATAGGRQAKPKAWYPPIYVRMLNARLAALADGTLQFRQRSGASKIIMIIAAATMIIVAIIGLYSKFWLVNHGGVFL